MTSNNLFGLELTRKSVSGDIKKEADHIIVLAHWFLVQRAQFGCLGNGSDAKLLDSDVCSELLPADWNLVPKTYALRYARQGKCYVLLGTVLNETIVLNLLSDTMETSNIIFDTASTAHEVQSAGSTASAPLHDILNRLNDEFLNKVLEMPKNPSIETQTESASNRSSDPVPDRDLPPHLRPQGLAPRWSDPVGNNPLAVGRGDLDPFHGGGMGGGGMLFQPPMRPGGGLGGGARFDPLGPVGPNGPILPRRPDHDHFRPPGFDDDSYFG